MTKWSFFMIQPRFWLKVDLLMSSKVNLFFQEGKRSNMHLTMCLAGMFLMIQFSIDL